MNEVAEIYPIDSARSEPLENIEAEAAFIGAALIDNRVIEEHAGDLRPRDFFEPLHQRIYERIIHFTDRNEAVTPVTLKPYFEADEALKELGGVSYLARLTSDQQGLLAPREIARQIHDLALRRRLRDRMKAMTTACLDLAVPMTEIVGLLEEVPGTAAKGGATFEILDLDELEQMPPPNWLVHEIIADDGFSIIYGDPGAGKSFVALDMALRIALGMDWHGMAAKQAGVLYIAGEGARGIGKRVTGWRMKQGLERLQCPFALLPVAVQLLDAGERTKLLRTIDEAVRKAGFPVGLIVVDTVSRAIAGQDENGQETMSAFVAACDAIKAHAGGALIGIHHSGKDKEKGMRGSTVLLGACDGVIKLTKSDRLVTLTFEKQKDAEEARPFYMQLEKVAWNTGSPDAQGEDYSTLVPVRVARPQDESETFSRIQIADAFTLLVDGWINGKPLSCKPQTRRDGRFAPAVFARKIGGQEQAWEGFLTAWLETGNVSYEIFDRKAKIFGLRVIDAII